MAETWFGRLSGPQQPSPEAAWKASEEERAIVCQLRRSTGFGLDELTFVLRHFLPHLNRDNIWRILKTPD